MNFHQYYKTDMLNGEGIRNVLFLSGCNHGCDGCYNESTWNPNSGFPFTKELEEEIIRDLKDERVIRDGITFSGGDPLHERNLLSVLSLVQRIRKECPGKTIWMWTGYTLKEIMEGGQGRTLGEDIQRRTLVNMVDTLVDGKFVKALHSPKLKWRGSENQIVWRKIDGAWVNCTPTDDITPEERKALHNKIEIKIV